MAKPEWGVKRTCTSCGCRFYDMTRTPITCPKCGANVEPEVPFKVRRGAAAKVAAPVKAVVVAEEVDDIAVVEEDEEAIDADDEGTDEDDSGLIEDASDLGADDDDMAEVMEHLDEEIEDEV